MTTLSAAICKTATTMKYLESQSFVSSKHRCTLAVFELCFGNGCFEICDKNPSKTHVKESFIKLQTADKKENVLHNSIFKGFQKEF